MADETDRKEEIEYKRAGEYKRIDEIEPYGVWSCPVCWYFTNMHSLLAKHMEEGNHGSKR